MNKQVQPSKKISKEAILKAIKLSMEDQKKLLAEAKKLAVAK